MGNQVENNKGTFKSLFTNYKEKFKSNTNEIEKPNVENLTGIKELKTVEDETNKPIQKKETETLKKYYKGTVKDGPGVNFRKEPDLNAEVIQIVKAGEDILVLDDNTIQNGKWTECKINNKIGYIMSQYIIVYEPVFN